ncbi:trypsin-like peptidase domain-containing protein [Streptomyces wuyuanensis]|uniref:trypsin-like peptidase domain-containing protein n=1 Tax=Streptomyces wuyuanensis TaxID=1196353 RepID=UPI0034235BAC
MTLPLPSDEDSSHHQQCTVWISACGEFLGSGFLVGPGTVVTAAHVVVEDASPIRDLVVHHVTGEYPVPDTGIYAKPSSDDGMRFYPFPDLATISIPSRMEDHPVLEIASTEAKDDSTVAALGYSQDTPAPGVQPERLLLRAAGHSGPYKRLLGDGIRPGHSGSALLNTEGQVCGVLKGSRSFSDDQGGWFISLATLVRFLGRDEITSSAIGAPPTDAEIVTALMAFPAMRRPDRRYDLIDKMGEHLSLPESFEVDDRPERRDHLYRIVHRCRHFRDKDAALASLYTAMEELVPYDGALEHLRSVIGRAVGGWEST